jgi:hypothetical protein
MRLGHFRITIYESLKFSKTRSQILGQHIMLHNNNFIEKTSLEESSPVDYYAECSVFLDDFLAQRPKLVGAEVREILASLNKVLLTDPSLRNFDGLATLQRLTGPFLLDDGSTSEPAASVAVALFLFGMAGKSLYFLSKQSHSHQFEKEIARLFAGVSEVRSNIWLFHTSAQLAQKGFQIEFIPEGKTPTPDFLATRGNVKVFVEANTRRPAQRDIRGIKDALWNVMHGDAKSGGKQIKFRDPQFDPGLIVVDISNCNVNSNETGLPPHLKLRSDAFVNQNRLGRIYDVSKDTELFDQQENTGNVMEFAIRYFHEMASTNKYFVRALLVGISMGVMTFEKGILGAPKGSIMVVDSRYPQLALQELSPQIYLVDTQSPLPSGRP